jgi:dTDP-4-dehydrorhamnose 3,5-epimerase
MIVKKRRAHIQWLGPACRGSMRVKKLSFDVKLLTPQVFRDARGFFMETFRQSLYESLGIHEPFPQDNLSYSTYGTIRGMHFQSMPGQAKLITVLKGKIFDVFVDIRPGSPTYGKWDAIYLDDQTKELLFLPIGCAHGFCVVSEDALVAYKVSSEYCPETECGFRFDDPEIGIKWPVTSPTVSQRDRQASDFSQVMAQVG